MAVTLLQNRFHVSARTSDGSWVSTVTLSKVSVSDFNVFSPAWYVCQKIVGFIRSQMDVGIANKGARR